ncbi:choline kinase alpha-like [Oppia nitens]|uniref:choline kinase alpha-like n=1 Tax=Oppia nitens TaxID=1686743 RepID=UPI0023DCE5F1|nr:choline kinase alpha-like [Oppia nitens]
MNSKLDSLRDCKTLDEIDFNKLKIIRDKTPDNINDRCLQLCKAYLSDQWCRQTIDSIVVNKLTGGLTNQIYHCSIKSPETGSVVPQEVAIRFYGKKYVSFDDSNRTGSNNERISDVVTALMVSRMSLGPKIYGMFSGGEIQAYYKHRIFGVEEQKCPELVTQVFKKLAKFHAMTVPVMKCYTMSKMMEQFYDEIYRNLPYDQWIHELNCQTLLAHDLKHEMQWIEELLAEVNSPQVYCHNDFRSNNIMILERLELNGNDRVLLCDFDGSAYGYRGQDFGTIMYEWGRDWNGVRDLPEFPSDKVLIQIIENYLCVGTEIHGQSYRERTVNSSHQLLREIKMGADIHYRNYWHLKQQFIEEKVI